MSDVKRIALPSLTALVLVPSGPAAAGPTHAGTSISVGARVVDCATTGGPDGVDGGAACRGKERAIGKVHRCHAASDLVCGDVEDATPSTELGTEDPITQVYY